MELIFRRDGRTSRTQFIFKRSEVCVRARVCVLYVLLLCIAVTAVQHGYVTERQQARCCRITRYFFLSFKYNMNISLCISA